jgi:hypothetical protein
MEEEEKDSKKEKIRRISNVTGGLMFSVALLYDLIEFILDWLGIGLVINPLIAIFAGLHFWLWFRLHDVSFMDSPKRLATKWITDIIEVIPGLDALILGSLAHTIGVLILLILVFVEDKTGVKIPIDKKISAPTLESSRLNTLKAGNSRMRKQGLTNVARGEGKQVRQRPTLDNTRAGMLQASSKMKNSRRRMDIESRPTERGLGQNIDISSDDEAAKIKRMKEVKRPDWTSDKEVAPALKVRQQRIDVGLRLGKTHEEAYAAALEAEKEDDKRKRGGL